MQAVEVEQGDFVGGLRAGRREAQSELFVQHRRAVTRILHRTLGNDPEVADLVQDVFYHALRGAKRYRGDQQGLEPWLKRIALFVARGLMRKRAVRRRYAGSGSADHEELAVAAVPTPEQLEALSRTFATFERLPEHERLPLMLSLTTPMSRAEMARACGISESTLKRRLIRAQARFQSLAASDPALLSRLCNARRQATHAE
jgi:RNA polymerase sigma-70 factor (ECF subfamily)